jgi:hypothetical protein
VSLHSREVIALSASLPNDLYDRLSDRLRHAKQYAETARAATAKARSGYALEGEVVAMMAGLDEQLLLVEQYAEAAERALGDALALLERARKERNDA